MALKVVISHGTKYKYDRKINLSPHIFRLRPAPHSRTPIENYSINIKPGNHFFNWQQDPFGNYLARLVFNEMVDELSIDVEIIADMTPINPFDFFIEESAEQFPFIYDENLKKELHPYLEINEKGGLLEEWVQSIDKTPRRTIDFLIDLNQSLYKEMKYTIRMEPGVQTCETSLKSKLGSCRDFAWLLVQGLRHLGLGARFVSGYLVQLKADEKSLDGPDGPEEDFTDLHAWAEVYIPGAGWIGLDATSGLLAGEGHIPLACTPHYESAAPMTGYTDICETEFSYYNKITRIYESPRVTKPYTEEQWNKIYQLGFMVDRELEALDVRLTMGGEPTFISIDDMEGEEWNTGSDSVEKRELAETLSRKLLKSFSNGGLLHHTQGKWYPGEVLPRWEIGLYWRKDGMPIWNNEKLLASPTENHNIEDDKAKDFLTTLSKYLGCSSDYIMPAYEDLYYFLWQESKLPVDLDPSQIDSDDTLARQKLSKILEKGLTLAAGYVMPLAWDKNHWLTSQWKFKRKELFLIPGNSPIGLRLPLESLITKAEKETDPIFEADLFANKDKLESFSDIVSKLKNKDDTKSKSFSRTAICTEVRNGNLFIFMPPIKEIDEFLILMAAIEQTAEELSLPIILEGYQPPNDIRIEKMKITPDPGVIEVNIHPSKSWKELTDNTLTLYEQARLSRLGTQKFMLDGRLTGTGGGNHITLGGETPSDSPLLRNPLLLQSLITFWQHHPGLSYLFSGAFVGPTSQAPRVDEGRHENLYELEIAFSQIPQSDYVPFWLTDRLFRNLLTDITGNTHRSEFCIDKLYSPDSASGRLGILELRAFDMPPHSQMSLLQMLLVRTLVSWFWKKPYKHNLVRWGTELHDRFLMEHYVREDINNIVDQLNEEGYPFKYEWFDPFFEFRFPLNGLVNINGMQIELRMSIEPWNVLGEEMVGSTTSRYVDSSMERIQVKISNFVEERYILSCNGVKIPLSRTGVSGEYVANVRYKAWQPWSSLHPTIGVDTPLVFDIIDKWNQRSIGGCTYFVSHPGGRAYDTYPVNSFEAESRRINRFWDFGHTQGEIPELDNRKPISETERKVVENSTQNSFNFIEVPVNNEFPHTLDLRQIKK